MYVYIYICMYIYVYIYYELLTACYLATISQFPSFSYISRWSQHCYLAIFIVLLELRRRVQQKRLSLWPLVR